MWIALLSYVGVIAGLMLVLISDAIWMAGGGNLIVLNDPPQPGLVGSAAANVFVTGVILSWPALLVFVPAGLYTGWAYWRAPHREPVERSEQARRVVSGFEVGAAVTATLFAALGPTYAFFVHYGFTSAMAEWPDVGRIVIFSVAMGPAAALVAVGTALHLHGDGERMWGRMLLWIGAMALTLAGVLDSVSATSLSGTTGTYVRSASGAPGVVPNDMLLNQWVGLGTFLLPAGVPALLLAFSVTHIHVPWHLHLPRYHRHTPTMSATEPACGSNGNRSRRGEPDPREGGSAFPAPPPVIRVPLPRAQSPCGAWIARLMTSMSVRSCAVDQPAVAV